MTRQAPRSAWPVQQRPRAIGAPAPPRSAPPATRCGTARPSASQVAPADQAHRPGRRQQGAEEGRHALAALEAQPDREQVARGRPRRRPGGQRRLGVVAAACASPARRPAPPARPCRRRPAGSAPPGPRRPVRSTLVAPMLPEPMARGSPAPAGLRRDHPERDRAQQVAADHRGRDLDAIRPSNMHASPDGQMVARRGGGRHASRAWRRRIARWAARAGRRLRRSAC